MQFFYRAIATTNPGITAGGASARIRPVLDVTVIGPNGDVVREALVDTGADEIILSDSDAPTLGIDLTNAPSGTFGGVGSPPMTVRFAWVKLRLTDGIEFREWDVLVGFAPLRLRRVIFGIAHGLEYFTATFHGDRRELELTPNAAYPGT